MRKVTMEDSKRVKNINKLDRYISRFNERNKRIARLQIEVDNFYIEYMDIGIRICEGYTVNKKLEVENCLEGLENGTVYIVNPSFVSRYMKQKWYVNYYDCMMKDNNGNVYFGDGKGGTYTLQ